MKSGERLADVHAEQPVSVQRGAPGTDGQQGKRARGQEGRVIMQQIIQSTRVLHTGFTHETPRTLLSLELSPVHNLPRSKTSPPSSFVLFHNTTPVPVTKLSLQLLS